jgi:hypothetical protein
MVKKIEVNFFYGMEKINLMILHLTNIQLFKQTF